MPEESQEQKKPIPKFIHDKLVSGKLDRDAIFERLRFWHGEGCDISPYLHLVEPGALQKIINFTIAVNETIARARESDVLVPNAVYESRMAICRTCEWFIKKSGTCAHCGCGLRRKVALASQCCPDNPPKWESYDPGSVE